MYIWYSLAAHPHNVIQSLVQPVPRPPCGWVCGLWNCKVNVRKSNGGPCVGGGVRWDWGLTVPPYVVCEGRGTETGDWIEYILQYILCIYYPDRPLSRPDPTDRYTDSGIYSNIHWFIYWLIQLCTDLLIYWLIVLLIDLLIYWLIDWFIDLLIDLLLDWFIDWFVDLFIDWFIDLLIDWYSNIYSNIYK